MRIGRIIFAAAVSTLAIASLSAVTPNYLLGFDEKRGSVFNFDHPAESLPIATFSKVLSSSRGTSTAK
jgi:hypothetical protein